MGVARLRSKPYDRKNVKISRGLRANMTDAEWKLWGHIRLKQIDGKRFRRQQPIGPYIVDFACLDKKLVVEVDGSQHMDISVNDDERTAFLNAEGYQVLRFWNNDVLQNIDGVIEKIELALGEK